MKILLHKYLRDPFWSIFDGFKLILDLKKYLQIFACEKKQDILPHETQTGTYHFEATVIMTDG